MNLFVHRFSCLLSSYFCEISFIVLKVICLLNDVAVFQISTQCSNNSDRVVIVPFFSLLYFFRFFFRLTCWFTLQLFSIFYFIPFSLCLCHWIFNKRTHLKENNKSIFWFLMLYFAKWIFNLTPYWILPFKWKNSNPFELQ